jgi:hypothetical protein
VEPLGRLHAGSDSAKVSWRAQAERGGRAASLADPGKAEEAIADTAAAPGKFFHRAACFVIHGAPACIENCFHPQIILESSNERAQMYSENALQNFLKGVANMRATFFFHAALLAAGSAVDGLVDAPSARPTPP